MIIIVAIFIFLLSLYVLSQDDFVLLRRNVSLVVLFDVVIVSGIVGLFFARLAYVFLHPSFAYFNPLVFLVIPYFPGLSLAGFLIGATISTYALGIKEKLPIGRMFDIFSLSLYPSSAVFFAWMLIESILKKNLFTDIVYAVFLLLVSVYFFFFKRFLAKSAWIDGSLSILSFAVFSIITLLLQFVLSKFKILPLEFSFYVFFLLALFFSFLIRQFKRAGER